MRAMYRSKANIDLGTHSLIGTDKDALPQLAAGVVPTCGLRGLKMSEYGSRPFRIITRDLACSSIIPTCDHATSVPGRGLLVFMKTSHEGFPKIRGVPILTLSIH